MKRSSSFTHAVTARKAHLPIKFDAENTPALPVARRGQSGKVLPCPQQDYPATSVANFCTALLINDATFQRVMIVIVAEAANTLPDSGDHRSVSP